MNHPVTGTGVATAGAWHHAAVTYDGQTWRLYLDGVLDRTLTLASPFQPRSDSIQHASIAAALSSTGVRDGAFNGVVDEVRIWNVARTGAEIAGAKASEIASAPNLIGRWGMNEAAGTVIGNSAGTAVDGNLLPATGRPVWVTGFPLPDTTPPAAPSNVSAAEGRSVVTVTWEANTESDVAGYNVYRSTTQPVPTDGAPLNTALLTRPFFNDRAVVDFTTYFYAITAVDNSSNASLPSAVVNATPQTANSNGLYFDGANDYVTFGAAPSLGTSTFTVEAWFKRLGEGTPVTTGTGGVPDAIPLVTKGTSEAEGSAVDANYFSASSSRARS